MIHTGIHDNGDGSITINRVQDAEPIIERCKALANSGIPQSPDMKLAASIPSVVVENYCNRNGITFGDFMQNPEHQRRMLNDPDLKYFRVWPGQI